LQTKGLKYVGHSAHVTNVEFTFDDKRLISTGGDDSWWVYHFNSSFFCKYLAVFPIINLIFCIIFSGVSPAAICENFEIFIIYIINPWILFIHKFSYFNF